MLPEKAWSSDKPDRELPLEDRVRQIARKSLRQMIRKLIVLCLAGIVLR